MKQIIKLALALLLIVSCKSAPLDKPGIPQGTSVQEWPVDSVDPSTLEPAFDDDTIGQAEYIKRYGK